MVPHVVVRERRVLSVVERLVVKHAERRLPSQPLGARRHIAQLDDCAAPIDAQRNIESRQNNL